MGICLLLILTLQAEYKRTIYDKTAFQCEFRHKKQNMKLQRSHGTCAAAMSNRRAQNNNNNNNSKIKIKNKKRANDENSRSLMFSAAREWCPFIKGDGEIWKQPQHRCVSASCYSSSGLNCVQPCGAAEQKASSISCLKYVKCGRNELVTRT